MNPFTNPNPKNLATRAQFLRLFIALTGGIAVGLAIYSSASTILALIKEASEGLFLPLLLALIMSFLLDPVVKAIEGEKISRTASIFIVFVTAAVLFMGMLSWLYPQWQQMFASLKFDLPRYTARFISLLRELEETLNSRLPFIEAYDLTARARSIAEGVLARILVETPRSALRLGSLFILVPLFSFFFLRDSRRILRTGISLTPNRYFEMAHDVSFRVNRQLAHFIRGRIIEATIIGLVVGVGLSVTDIRYAPLLGLFAGVTNLIPYIGPVIGMVPGILIALADLGTGPQFWWILIVYILIAQVLVDNFILIPVLISRVSDLHPLWVILAIIMGGKLFGVLGMIIGVPVASIIKIVILEIRHYQSAFFLPGTSPRIQRFIRMPKSGDREPAQ